MSARPDAYAGAEWSGRHAGMVRRYHACPTIQSQTVADHCWHVLRIYIELWGTPRPELMVALLHHDSAEHMVGDVPFGAKQRVPNLSELLAAAEARLVRENVPQLGDLTELEEWRLKACDLLEMAEFGLEETKLGSRYGVGIVTSVESALERMSAASVAGVDDVELVLERLGRVSDELC